MTKGIAALLCKSDWLQRIADDRMGKDRRQLTPKASPASKPGTARGVSQPQLISRLSVDITPSVTSVVYSPTEPVSQIGPVYP